MALEWQRETSKAFKQKCLLGGKSGIPGLQDKKEKDYYRQREQHGEAKGKREDTGISKEAKTFILAGV